MGRRSFTVGIAGGIALVAGVGWWFWSLSAVMFASPAQDVSMIVESAPVEIRTGASGTWKAVDGTTRLSATDEIRTGSGGAARLRFFDHADVRMDERTHIALRESALSAVDVPTIKIHLLDGHVWSHILPFSAFDGAFSLEAPVFSLATRGASFDIETYASGSRVWVIDAVADVRVTSSTGREEDAESVSVPEGYAISLSADGHIGSMMPRDPAAVSEEWTRKNRTEDDRFDLELRQALQEHMRASVNAEPDSMKDSLVGYSERLRLALADDQEVPRLHAAYVLRRLYGAKMLLDQGKSGLAMQTLPAREAELRSAIDASGEPIRSELQIGLCRFLTLFANAAPSSPEYRFMQRVEDMLASAAADEASVLNARLMSIRSRLHLTAWLVASASFDEARVSADAAGQGIENVERDMAARQTLFSNDELRVLKETVVAFKARYTAARLRIATAAIPSVPVEAPEATAPSSTDPVLASTGTVPLPESTPLPVITDLALIASPNPILVGELATVQLAATHDDGTVTDVTALASFRVMGESGSMSGPSFVGKQEGWSTIEATIPSAQKTAVRRATTRVQVKEASLLARIDVMPERSVNVKQGQQVGIIVKAYYTDGRTAIVTPQTTWMTSDPNLGTVVNGVFTAWIHGQGDVTVTGTYSEKGVTKSSPLILTVTP